MATSPLELPTIEALRVVVGNGGSDHTAHYLNHVLESPETLLAFQEGTEEPWNPRNTSATDFLVKLTAEEAQVFPRLIRWLNGDRLGLGDSDVIINDDTVSEWCILHVLAQRFSIPSLTKESLSRYQVCRAPFWQGTWLPLEGEIEYLYRRPRFSFQMRHLLVKHFMAETFSSWSKGDIQALATLAAANVDFNCDIFRAHKEHLTLEIHPSEFCGVQGCLIHSQWTQSDVDWIERAPSFTPEPTQSDCTCLDEFLDEEKEGGEGVVPSAVLEPIADPGDLSPIQRFEQCTELPVRGTRDV